MIKIVAQNYIKADKIDAFIELATELVKATRANDKGCIYYELLQDVKDPQVMTILEHWENQEALQAHGQSEHYQKAMGVFPEYIEKPGEMHLYKTLV